jgi:hypothetical protein
MNQWGHRIDYRILKFWTDLVIAKFRAILNKGTGFFTIAIDTQVCLVFLEGERVIVTHHFVSQYLWSKFYNYVLISAAMGQSVKISVLIETK